MKGVICILITFVGFWQSCQTRNETEGQGHTSKQNRDSLIARGQNTNTPFAYFLRKYKNIELPVVIKACKISTAALIPYSGTDSLFMTQGSIPYCTFQTNGNFIAVISLGFADCNLPLLTTFDMNGKKIDEKCICIGGCGVGPGFKCDEYMIIRKDYTIYTSDSIIENEVDSLGNNVKGTSESYVIYKEGKLLLSGKIKLSNEQRKDISK